MVYEHILFIKGAKIPVERILSIFDENFSFKEKWINFYKEQNSHSKNNTVITWEEMLDHFSLPEIIENFNSEKDFFNDELKIHRWKCCSELNDTYVFIGKRYGKCEVNQIFETKCNVPSFDKGVDEEVKQILNKLNLDFPLESILMLDDCVFCS